MDASRSAWPGGARDVRGRVQAAAVLCSDHYTRLRPIHSNASLLYCDIMRSLPALKRFSYLFGDSELCRLAAHSHFSHSFKLRRYNIRLLRSHMRVRCSRLSVHSALEGVRKTGTQRGPESSRSRRSDSAASAVPPSMWTAASDANVVRL